MKKLLTCTLLVGLMLSVLAVNVSAFGETMTIPYGTPVVDGQIDEVWASADRQQLGYTKAGDLKVNATTLPEDCTVYASALWDETGLYFLFEITDNEFEFWSSLGDWKNDGIYLYVDEENSRGTTWTDYQNQIALIPEEDYEMIPRKGTDLEDYEYAYSYPTDNTCVIEFKFVPRGKLVLEAGTVVDIDFQYNDSNDVGGRDYCLGWADEDDSASNTSAKWGQGTLIGKDGETPAAEEPAEEAPAAEEPTYTYPASGESGDIITGELIGNTEGWGGNADAGRDAAFDGNPATFFDPLGVGDGYVGIDAGENYILDKAAILSRDGWADRFDGAEIRANDVDDPTTAVTLWKSDAAAASTTDYTVITDFENNTGYRYFFYFNEKNHGDVAEVEFYGHPGNAGAAEEAPVEETVEVEPAETVDTPVDEELETKAEAPQTFDLGIIAAVAAVVSLAGFAVSKKH